MSEAPVEFGPEEFGPVEFGFVAAMPREVQGLVRGWTASDVRGGGKQGRIYRCKQAVLICAGTGVERAYEAAKLLVENCSPQVLISIGFAGACVRELQPGSVVVPASLVDAVTGKEWQCGFGGGRLVGRLVTLGSVAGKAGKQEAFGRFGATAVDMEAAGVARAAAECDCQFAAIKAISDGADEDLGFLSGFVTPEGFATGRFVAHIAVRPALWPRVAALSRNSRLAAVALAAAVGECMNDWRSFSAKQLPSAAQVGMKES
jgi:adenosylhomocysteine nucleosidase